VSFTVVAPAQYQARGGTIEVRRDSLTGALLGTSEEITATADQAPLRRRVALRPSSGGMHDLYFVFRNPGVKGDGLLFGVLTATFEVSP
jgi:hypothetical protein